MVNYGKPFQAGEPVLFIDKKNREYYDVLDVDKTTNLRGDLLIHNDIIDREEAFVVRSRKNAHYQVFRPTLEEHTRLMPRGAQVIYPKDIGQILTLADIYPGAYVVECGLGSGALSSFLLRSIGPTGTLVSYEIRSDFVNNATKNLRSFFGEPENHIIRDVDIYESFVDENVDRLILDVPEPWRALDHVAPRLRPGAAICIYLPTILQVKQAVDKLHSVGGFTKISTLETLQREWKVDHVSVRPEQRMIGHTAFLIFARKITLPERRNRETENDQKLEENKNPEAGTPTSDTAPEIK